MFFFERPAHSQQDCALRMLQARMIFGGPPRFRDGTPPKARRRSNRIDPQPLGRTARQLFRAAARGWQPKAA